MGEGQLSKQESNNVGLTSSRLSSGNSIERSIPGLESPYPMPITRDGVDPSGSQRPGGYRRGAHEDDSVTANNAVHGPTGSQQAPPTSKVHLSHGGLTSSSAYGSGYEGDYKPSSYSRPACHNNTDPRQDQGFGGFGGKFGERSLMTGRSVANRGKARRGGGGGLTPGYAPSSGGGVEAALSSNAFASGHSQNCGNV
ncbi:unnamed protein product, partial [Ectocarpus sp. 12 AP-2014]